MEIHKISYLLYAFNINFSDVQAFLYIKISNKCFSTMKCCLFIEKHTKIS